MPARRGEFAMAQNPMKTRKEWQAEKKKYGIPDNIIKSGSFGEKMEKLQKKFASLGVGTLTLQNAMPIVACTREADLLLDEWLTAAQKRKATDFTNQKGAIDQVGDYKKAVAIVRFLAEAKANPIGMSKANWKSFENMWNAAKRDPTNVNKMQTMYSQGIRNAIGQGFHDAYKMKDQLHLPANVKTKLEEYEQIAAEWNHLQGGAQILGTDATVRVKFWKDMTKAANLGKQIIQLSG
jgi:hypothetical protein